MFVNGQNYFHRFEMAAIVSTLKNDKSFKTPTRTERVTIFEK